MLPALRSSTRQELSSEVKTRRSLPGPNSDPLRRSPLHSSLARQHHSRYMCTGGPEDKSETQGKRWPWPQGPATQSRVLQACYRWFSSASDEENAEAVTHIRMSGFTPALLASTLTIWSSIVCFCAMQLQMFSPNLPMFARWQCSERSIQPLGLA